MCIFQFHDYYSSMLVIDCLQVALGQTNDLLAADYSADRLPTGKNSTKGLGRIAPDPAQTETL